MSWKILCCIVAKSVYLPILIRIFIQANEDSAYAVFISYIEVYNNYIFDLLEDGHTDQVGNPILPESKKVGEDPRYRIICYVFHPFS